MSEPTTPAPTPAPPPQRPARKATASAGAPATSKSLLEEARELAEQQPSDNTTAKERDLEDLKTRQAELTDEIVVFDRAKRTLEERIASKIEEYDAEIATREAEIDEINEQLRAAGQPVVATSRAGKSKEPEPKAPTTKVMARAQQLAEKHPKAASRASTVKKAIVGGKTFTKDTHKTI